MLDLPIRFLVVCIVILLVVSVALWQLNVFLDFNMKNNFKQDINLLRRVIESERSRGSVLQNKISIPNNYNFSIDIDNNKIIGNLSGEIYEINTENNIFMIRLDNTTYSDGIIVFPSGVIRISVYFGELDNLKEYMVVVHD